MKKMILTNNNLILVKGYLNNTTDISNLSSPDDGSRPMWTDSKAYFFEIHELNASKDTPQQVVQEIEKILPDKSVKETDSDENILEVVEYLLFEVAKDRYENLMDGPSYYHITQMILIK